MSNTTTIDPELRIALKKLRLGKMIPTLPERLLLARQNKLSHDAFMLLLLRDEIDRRDSTATARRAHTAGLDPDMVLERWDNSTKVHFDRHVLDELAQRRDPRPRRRRQDLPRHRPRTHRL